MYRTSITISDEQGEMLRAVAKARGMSINELVGKFAETQYQIVMKDSEVNQALKDMEQLAKRLETISAKFNAEKPME